MAGHTEELGIGGADSPKMCWTSLVVVLVPPSQVCSVKQRRSPCTSDHDLLNNYSVYQD